MNILFYFLENADWSRLIPSAKPKDNSKCSEILSYYLSEVDEVFANYMLNRVNKIDRENLDLSSESWAAIVSSNEVEMYFIFDEDNSDYKTNINKADFIRALTMWKDFVKATPNKEYTIDVII